MSVRTVRTGEGLAADTSRGERRAVSLEALAELALRLRDLVRVHQALGISHYPGCPDLHRWGERFGGAAAQASLHDPTDVSAPSAAPSPSEAVPGRVDVALQPEELERAVAGCTRCPLAAAALARCAGSGPLGAALMVVGDWARQVGAKPVLFGPEEDVLLWNMMRAIGLGPETVYVSNLCKCIPADVAVPPDIGCGRACLEHLLQEIALVRPKALLLMGELAGRVVLASREPVSRLRGRLCCPLPRPLNHLPVMTTYHPRFLLRREAMKRAAWQDLQELQRCLSRPGPHPATDR
ncbi:MAG: uracil-DNA glycosylase [Desulfobulbus sp.]